MKLMKCIQTEQNRMNRGAMSERLSLLRYHLNRDRQCGRGQGMGCMEAVLKA